MAALLLGVFFTSLFWLNQPEPPANVVAAVGIVSQTVGFFVGGYLAARAVEQDGAELSVREDAIAKIVADIFSAALLIQLLRWTTGEIEHSWYYHLLVFGLQLIAGAGGCALFVKLNPWVSDNGTTGKDGDSH